MQEHLIVDGNNAMHAIPEVSVELGRDRNLARDSLLRMLEPVVGDGNRLTVVFDGRGGKGVLTRHNNLNEFDVYYSSSYEGADGAIERMVMAAKNPEKICVITNDGLIRNCAYEHGSSAMKVGEFLKRLDHSIDQISRRVRQNSPSKNTPNEPFNNGISFPEGFQP